MKHATKPTTPPQLPSAKQTSPSGLALGSEDDVTLDDPDDLLGEAETPHCIAQGAHRMDSRFPVEPTTVVPIDWEPEAPSTKPPGRTYSVPPPGGPSGSRDEPPSSRSMEISLRERIWSGLGSEPATQLVAVPAQAPAPVTPMPMSVSSEVSASVTSGSYPSRSGQREIAVARPPVSPAPLELPPERMPVGYIIASAFFLAIAFAGFGLWLAFEVISL